MKRILLLPCLLIMAAVAWAQGPNNTGEYYKAADGKKGAALKTALCGIIYNRNENSYDALWNIFKKTDKRIDENGKTLYNKDGDSLVWDMYSNKRDYIFVKDQAGNYSNEGDKYNREHSFPKSWFGDKNGSSVAGHDIHHIFPTDGSVNGKRSNHPFGETNGEEYKSANGFSKLGACTYSGYTGTVFEPNDLYKGDFARTYFYMVTCYEEQLPTWYKNYASSFPGLKATIDGSTYPGFQTWQLNMLMTWAANDQVSYKEYYRNIAAYGEQKNRNPYIDYPGLEQYIWGSMTDEAFSYDDYQVPENYTLYVPGDDPGPDPDDPPIIVPSDGEFVYQRVTKDTDLEEGAGYIIVCEEPSVAMADQNGSTYRNRVSVVMNDGTITTAVNTSGKPYEVTLGTSNGKYTLYDATDKVYLALTSSDNRLHAATSATASTAQWTITISGNNAVIKNAKYTEYSINYNSGSPRFACYKSSSNQKSVQLYKRQPVSASITTEAAFPVDKAKPNTIIYDLQGRKVGTTVNGTPHLKKGVYIMSGRKVIAN